MRPPTNPIAGAIADTLLSHEVDDGRGNAANVVDALAQLADAIRYGTKWLGNGDAATPFGALEAHGLAVKDAAAQIAAGLHDIADAIRSTRDA